MIPITVDKYRARPGYDSQRDPEPDRRFLSYVWALHMVPNTHVFRLQESNSFAPDAITQEFIGIYVGVPFAVAQNELPHLRFEVVAEQDGYVRTGELRKISLSSLLHGEAIAEVTKRPGGPERIRRLEKSLPLEHMIEEVPLV